MGQCRVRGEKDGGLSILVDVLGRANWRLDWNEHPISESPDYRQWVGWLKKFSGPVCHHNLLRLLADDDFDLDEFAEAFKLVHRTTDKSERLGPRDLRRFIGDMCEHAAKLRQEQANRASEVKQAESDAARINAKLAKRRARS